jgi:hypothetical protein
MVILSITVLLRFYTVAFLIKSSALPILIFFSDLHP